MKVQPTPTSPKAKLQVQQEDLHTLYREELQNIDHPPTRRRMSILALFLAVLFGFSAGILGEVFTEQYIYPWLNITPAGSSTTVTVAPKTKASATAAAAALVNASRSVIGIAEKREGALSAATAYSAGDAVGSAVLLSDDGWAVTSSGVFAPKKTYVAITADHAVVAIDTKVDDPSMDVTYIHLADAANLSVATLGSAETSAGGAYTVLAPSDQPGQIRSLPVVAQGVLSMKGLLLFSDERSRVAVLAQTLPAAYAGGPLVSADGAVLGIVRSDGWQNGSTVWPIADISTILPGLLKDGQIVRPAFGVHYVNLALAAGIPTAEVQGKKNGTLITGTNDAPAIAKKSAAEKAGIRSGDIITAVGSQSISGSLDLADIIAGYTAGQTVDMTVVRKKAETKLKVTLGSTSATAP